MTISFYNTVSESNRVDKVLTGETTLTGTLRDNTNVLTPTITIQSDTSILGFNYAYIPEFKRYYYVTGCTSIRQNLWELTFSVDVLKTYAAQIKALTVVVERQETKFNLYLQDPDFKLQTNSQVVTKKFPVGFTGYGYVMCTSGASAVKAG